MGISVEVIEYVLYIGLGMSILSFVLLVMSMFGKSEAGPIFDQVLNEEYEEEELYQTDEFEEIEEKQKKSFFSFGRKKSKVEHDFEDVEFEEEYEEESEDEEEDEYKEEFEFSFREEEMPKRTRETISGFDLDKYNYKDEEEDDDFGNLEIKKYKEADEEEIYDRMSDTDVDEEEEMMKRINQYKNKFKN